ncbi:DEAD/DEAH box helicase isoform X1 [Carex rostrata]
MHSLCSSSLTPIFPFSSLHFRSLGFLQFNPKVPLRITPIRSRKSSKEQLSLPHNEFELESGGEDEEDEEDDEFDEYEDDDIAADEYSIDSDASEEEEGDEEGWSDSDTVASFRQSEEDKADRVNKLLEQVREFGAEIIDYQEVAAIYDFPIDRFQRLAIQAFLRGSSVIVSAPTSSGKTLIAEASALATLARGRRLFYTTPLKALSNQKLRDFRRTFGDHNVGLVTGDCAINIEAPILIMTTEILRNMLYQSVGVTSSDGRLFHVDAIVLDEVHYLSDISRGTVWEEIVIYCPKEVQLICLSATVANSDELAGWIGQIHGTTELITSSKRPVPLTWHFSRKDGLLRLLDENGKKMNRKLSREYLLLSSSRKDSYDERGKRQYRSGRSGQRNNGTGRITQQAPVTKNDINNLRRSQVPQIRDTLSQLQRKDMLPAIWFVFSRRGCDAAVQYVEQCMLLNECEASEVELELQRFKSQYPDAVREVAMKGLLRGVAAHHAGCLPLWKSFIEELFQRGLVKVVFATETLAAGINMPARTTVISSLIKRTGAGRTMLTPNELLQMAGRAGRRGIDKAGHVVLLQTPYEGPEECCDVLFAGIVPLVSQFTASYGMVLNLLAGSKLTNKGKELEGTETSHPGRTLEEARKLVEQSFGNYVGSNVVVAAEEELKKIKQDIEQLSSEITDEAIDRKCQEQLTEEEYAEISVLQEQLRQEKKVKRELRKQMELKRMTAWKQLLEECQDDDLPFMCLQYKDNDLVEHVVPAVFIGKLASLSSPGIMDMVNREKQASNIGEIEPSYYVALSSDNTWYIFTEKWIKMVYKTGLSGASPVEGGPLARATLKQFLLKEEMQWDKLADSEFGPLFCMEGSLDTWSWSLNVPVLSSLSVDDEVQILSQEYLDAVENYREQRRKVSNQKKMVKGTKGFLVFKQIVDARKFTIDKIGRLETRSRRLARRISQIEPTGWKEFLQISRVIQETRAMDISKQLIYPLGKTAAAIRGENELWVAMVLRNKVLRNLKPSQLAAVCGSLVSEGIKLRPTKSESYVYEPSSTVLEVINYLDEHRNSLIQIQEKYGVEIPCALDGQFSGMVEAWAAGLTWREIMMDCAMDDGDLARLLRRTIDLLAQIPKLPDIDSTLQQNAQLASNVMDRSPISELVG